eukprot:gene1460-849_t
MERWWWRCFRASYGTSVVGWGEGGSRSAMYLSNVFVVALFLSFGKCVHYTLLDCFLVSQQMKNNNNNNNNNNKRRKEKKKKVEREKVVGYLQYHYFENSTVSVLVGFRAFSREGEGGDYPIRERRWVGIGRKEGRKAGYLTPQQPETKREAPMHLEPEKDNYREEDLSLLLRKLTRYNSHNSEQKMEKFTLLVLSLALLIRTIFDGFPFGVWRRGVTPIQIVLVHRNPVPLLLSKQNIHIHRIFHYYLFIYFLIDCCYCTFSQPAHETGVNKDVWLWWSECE